MSKNVGTIPIIEFVVIFFITHNFTISVMKRQLIATSHLKSNN